MSPCLTAPSSVPKVMKYLIPLSLQNLSNFWRSSMFASCSSAAVSMSMHIVRQSIGYNLRYI